MNKRRGFTLVELLVVLFIIVLLVAVGLPRVRDYGKRNGLRTAAQEIKSQILYAQALARTPDRKGVTQYVFMINFSNSNYCLTTTASPAVCVPDQPNVIAKISQNYMIVYAVGNAGADNSVVKPPTLVPSDIGYYNSSGTDSCPNDSYYSVDFKVPSAQMGLRGIYDGLNCDNNTGILKVKYSNDSDSNPAYGYAQINMNYISGDVGIQSCMKGVSADTCN